MINVMFKDNKASGCATVGYSSSDTEEVIIEKPEQELTDPLSDILEQGETWRDKYRYLSWVILQAASVVMKIIKFNVVDFI